MKKLITMISLLALATGMSGCNSAQSPARESAAAASAEPRTTHEPLDIPVRARAVHGALRARTGSPAWQDMAAGDELTGVSELSASGKGAVVSLGSGEDTLWLRGGSQVRLARQNKGVRVELVAGQARVRSATLGAYATVGHASVAFTGRDVLLHKPGTDADAVLAYTSALPERAAWSLALDASLAKADANAPQGIGVIEVAGQQHGRELLELRRMDISVTSAGDYAYTEVEHVFYNPNGEQLEGTFRFPLPDGAMPLGLAMEINGRMMEGEIVEREKARKTYQSIVDSMQDPALLEWQQGNLFKLRVFPIEPRSEKRIVFRYAAPLAPAIDGWEYVYATQAPAMHDTIGHLRLRFNNDVIVDRDDFVAGNDVIVPVSAATVPATMQEVRAERSSGATAGTYTAVRVVPDWSRLGAHAMDARPGDAGQDPGRTVLVVMDTSRSALEGRAMGLKTLEMTLAELEPGDRFLVLAADITTRAHADDFVAMSPEAARAAMDFVGAIEPDGASDLGAAFARAGELLTGTEANAEIIYIGDGTPTWGITDPRALRAHIDTSLGRAQIHAAIIGKGASTRAWQSIAGARAGRVAHPRSMADARRFAFVATRSNTAPRIEGLKIAGVDEHTKLFPQDSATLYQGDTLVAIMRTEPGHTPPAELTLEGRYAGKPFTQRYPVRSSAFAPAATPLVAQRWATLEIADLQASGADKAAIVALSKDFGVMSKHTSLLVLESDEAYRQHGIERKRALAQNDPRVTGGDLDSLGERSASLSPDHIQPGDPEIRIPAPANARRVVVIFPFGDTKLARFDHEANAWITRFLIDKDTPDGEYTVLVKVTLDDGSVQTYRLPYYVDTKAPKVKLSVRRTRTGRYVFTARQIVSAAEMRAAQGRSQAGPADMGSAQIIEDARRVELWLPSGRVLALARKRAGLFRRTWKPESQLSEPVTLRVVVTDQALNQSTFALIVHPDGTSEIAPLDQTDAESAAMNTRGMMPGQDQ